MRPRLILHVDMDAFFVSVELLRNEHLRGSPVIVGGDGPRGVVAAASYEARAFGVHSAQPSVVARRRCPQATFLDGDHAHYRTVSERVMDVLSRYSPVVEPLSLDEAFLDITGTAHLFGSPMALAQHLRDVIWQSEQLRCSVGIGPNKFLAKMASEAAKPSPSPTGPVPGRGVVVVAPSEVAGFLGPLPVKALWGVGTKTQSKLERIGIATIGDLASADPAALEHAIGKASGQHLFALANGRDDRPVVAAGAPKSISHEQTYPVDVSERDRLELDLLDLADRVADRLRGQGLRGRRVTLKIRFGDFTTWTRQQTLTSGTASRRDINGVARSLLDNIDISPGVRLLGVGVGELSDGQSGAATQLSFDDIGGQVDDGQDQRQEWDVADRAIADIRARFGSSAIGPASLVSQRRSEHRPWGPSGESRSSANET